MMKFWKIKGPKKTDVIIIDDSSIIKGKFKNEELNHYSKQLENNIIPNTFFNIPFSYIRRIENQSGKKEIKIFYGTESEEELNFNSVTLKNEVFEYLKNNTPNMIFSENSPSLFKYAKAQLFAVLFTLGISLWSLHYAIQIENGVQYELRGRAGLSSIIYSIGLLGVFKVILLFSILIGIAIYSLIKRIKSRSEIKYLKRIK